MNNFLVQNRVFIKTKNSTYKINIRYIYSLLAIMILTILINYLFNYKAYAISLTKSIIISLIFTSILNYLSNLSKKEYNPLKIYTNSNTIIVSLLIGCFATGLPIYIIITACFISTLIKYFYQKLNTSVSIYGILLIIVYTYLNNITNIDNIKLLVPILSIIAFIYLFFKRSIKYNLNIAYYLTIFSIIFLYTILSHNTANFLLEKLTINGLLLLSVYALPDYQVTPTINEANTIFGLITGLITTILIFIYPSIAVILPIILGHLVFTRLLDGISHKLKYQKKIYYIIIISMVIISIITIICLLYLYK